MQSGFVARGFSGMIDHLSELIQQAIAHPGFALIDVLQPCVSFNKVNTFAWYRDRCHPLLPTYDPTDWEKAMKVAREWGDNIPVGIIYRNDRLPFEKHFPVLSQGSLVGRDMDRIMLKRIMEGYG
jgi:2-oxoglutarate ferredoxin oxidoreductase subunit beta